MRAVWRMMSQPSRWKKSSQYPMAAWTPAPGLESFHQIPLSPFSDNSYTKDEAMVKVKKFTQQGQGLKKAAELYDQEGQSYDKMLGILNYSAPKKAGQIVQRLLGDKTNVKVLDIGAGTGLMAEILREMGFTNIDAVDCSEGMLEVARKKNIYGQLVCHFLGEEQMPFPDDCYDVVTIVGAMGENHIPLKGIEDIIRVVKSGGYIVNVFREPALHVPYYNEGLGQFISQLETNGVWTLIEKNTFPEFLEGVEGFYMVHRKN